MTAYLVVARNWSYMTEDVLVLSGSLVSVQQYLKTMGFDCEFKDNLLITKRAFLPYLECEAIYELTKEESEKLGIRTKDNCWYLYIIKCENPLSNIKESFNTLHQCAYWNDDEEDAGNTFELFRGKDTAYAKEQLKKINNL